MIAAVRWWINQGIFRFQSSARNRQARRKIKRLLSERNEIRLEVGSGKKAGTDNWVTMDMEPEADICWDLSNGIPLPDGSVTMVYSSHFFEHLSFREAQIFLDECRRVLIPGGTFSICVPNARLYIEAYARGQSMEEYLKYKPAVNNTTRIDCVNYMAYMDGHHKYMFDEENLIHILEAKGFLNVHLRPFDPGLDLADRDYESIYAEGKRG